METATPGSGTVKVKARFDNQAGLLWPGAFANVSMTVRTLKDAVVVPQAAIILRGQERVLSVAGADNIAQLRTGQVRFEAGDSVAVEGVKPGERVVLEGKQNLRPGGEVREAPAGPGKGASAAASAASAGVSR